MHDDDVLVEPPRPKPEATEFHTWHEQYQREEQARRAAQEKRDAAYEQRSRDFKITKSAVLGGEAYPEEE